MNPKELIQKHLSGINILQLATSHNDEPWICTVHFCMDKNFNIYWVSRTDRKHSQQIASNPKASVTAVVHQNSPDEDYVIAVSATGTAEITKDASGDIRNAYQTKLNKPPNMLPDPNEESNLQEFYCLKPEKFILFDTKNLTGNPRLEIKL